MSTNKFKINGKAVKKVNQLLDPETFDKTKLRFCDITEGSVPGTDIKFKRTNLLYQADESKEEFSELIFSFDKMFTFGVSVTLDTKTQEPAGHSMSHCLYSRDGATEREIRIVDKLKEMNEACKDFVWENRKALGKGAAITSRQSEIMNQDMDKLLYYKKDEDGNIDETQGPTISPRLIEYEANERVDKKTGKKTLKPYQMCTLFYLQDEVDENGEPIEVNPLDYISTKERPKYCHATSAMKFESVFVGKNIRVQCKLTESFIEPMQQGSQRLLKYRPTTDSSSRTKESGVNPMLNSKKSKSSDDNEDESSELNDDEEEKPSRKEKKSPKKKKSKSKDEDVETEDKSEEKEEKSEDKEEDDSEKVEKTEKKKKKKKAKKEDEDD